MLVNQLLACDLCVATVRQVATSRYSILLYDLLEYGLAFTVARCRRIAATFWRGYNWTITIANARLTVLDRRGGWYRT